MGEVAELLGRAPLPPRWALGFLQSTRHFDDTDELRRLPRTIREKRIPCDALIFLSTYGEAQGWNRGVGHLEFQPDAVAEAGGAARRGARAALRGHHPRVPGAARASRRSSPRPRRAAICWRPATSGGAGGAPTIAQGQRYLDFSNPAVRAWWWAAHRELVRARRRRLVARRRRGAAGRARSSPAATARCCTTSTTASATRPSPRARPPTGPSSAPSCSAARARPGMQRFGASTWSGDINNDFPTLRGADPARAEHRPVGRARTGAPTSAASSTRCRRPASSTRAGSSSARSARSSARTAGCGASTCRGPTAPRSRRSAARYAELRYRLLPYTYTLAWQAHTQGLPLMRPLVLNYPDDPRMWALDHEYLLGRRPAGRAGDPRGRHRVAGLSAARELVRLLDGRAPRGPGGVTVEAPLERLPLLVRGRRDPAARPGRAAHRRAAARRAHAADLSGRAPHASSCTRTTGARMRIAGASYALTPIVCETAPGRVTVRIEAATGDRSVVPAGAPLPLAPARRRARAR